MRRHFVVAIVIAFVSSTIHAEEASEPVPQWKAGVASIVITPERPLRMAGYGGRTDPADGTVQDLFAKCVTFEDQQGQRVAIITLDLIGVLAELRSAVVEQLNENHKLSPQAVLMNASHTHCGPAYGRDDAKDYFEQLTQKIVRVVGESIERLHPATLSYSVARASVAMNRRTPSATGFLNHPNPLGRLITRFPSCVFAIPPENCRRLSLDMPATTQRWVSSSGTATMPATLRSIWKPIIRV